ncbi:protein phosphatase inhibitor 2-like [Amphiura filiformis]|uniref:protein phosphatase inhibitor 2-like n=1 Tax=Amphiura filiformis TaxID=82378 RepID=UPI003B225C24
MADSVENTSDEKPAKVRLPEAKKGILKSPGHYDDPANRPEEGIKWDEMNILQTFHPPGKDYGHMKVDEPDTPYNKMIEGDDDEMLCEAEKNKEVNADVLSKKLETDTAQKRWWDNEPGEEESSEEEEEHLTAEEQEKLAEFKEKRKHHYNEAYNMQLAKQLIEQELAELDDEESNPAGAKDSDDKGANGATISVPESTAEKTTEEDMQH